MNWYTLSNTNNIDSPALLLYPDRIQHNISKAIELAGSSDLLRPHVKTNKIAEVCQLMMDAGITRFKCATIAEAEMLGMIGAPDVLLAHQPVGPKIARFRKLTEAYPTTHFSCIFDDIGIATELAACFSDAAKPAQVFIDVNNGMKRSGILPSKALALFSDCRALAGIEIIGLHAYDGHVKNSDPIIRKRESDEAFAPVSQLLAEITKFTSTPMQVVVGGSPSFPTHTQRKGVQYSPGTFVFWDWGYQQQLPDEPFLYAALVLTRVVSILDATTICVDLGHKAVAAENPLPRVYFLNAPEAIPVGHSEEHLVVTVPDSGKWKPGDVLYGVPFHICPTVALYDQAAVVEEHEVRTYWKVIARSRTINI